jgi:hypothetical protein
MKFIPLGLQCSVSDAIRAAGLCEYSYPFDWLWCPSKTTFNILHILINDGIENAVEYMTTNYTYYEWLNNEHYKSVDYVTTCQINSFTGLGYTHFTINAEYKNKLRVRFERLLRDIHSSEPIVFLYTDSANPYFNYHIDEVEYGVDATEYLLKIYDLIYPIHNNIKIIYFCWNERNGGNKKEGNEKEGNEVIEYFSYDHKSNWFEVSAIIKNYLTLYQYNNSYI